MCILFSLSAFGLDETEALLLYLTQLFLPSKEGRRKEDVDAVKETVSKARQVTRRISNKDELLKMLKKSLEHVRSIWSTINPFHAATFFHGTRLQKCLKTS